MKLSAESTHGKVLQLAYAQEVCHLPLNVVMALSASVAFDLVTFLSTFLLPKKSSEPMALLQLFTGHFSFSPELRS